MATKIAVGDIFSSFCLKIASALRLYFMKIVSWQISEMIKIECQGLHSQRFKKILLNLSSAVEVVSLLTFCTLETPKQVCWQAAKTQMIRVCPVCEDKIKLLRNNFISWWKL